MPTVTTNFLLIKNQRDYNVIDNSLLFSAKIDITIEVSPSLAQYLLTIYSRGEVALFYVSVTLY